MKPETSKYTDLWRQLTSHLPEGKWRSALLLLVLCLGLYLPGITSLPPFDRDEARYAQASRQMIESGDYTRIFFQDTPRHKKPVGIYWLQSAAVSLFDVNHSRHIFYFRLPSILTAIASVLLFYFFTLKLCSPQIAFMAAGILASTTSLTAEAHLATTDAALLLCAVACLGPLLALRAKSMTRLSLPDFLLLWGGLGAGVLIKGPVLPGILFLTIAAMCVVTRSVRWISGLRPASGALFSLLIVLPWLLSIQSQTGGAFLRESFGGDILPKFTGVHESHGGFPGYYLLGSLASFWPWSFLLIPVLSFAWRTRKEPYIMAALCWLAPSWVLLEFVPTRLPHYSLPLFPPLALLCAIMLSRVGLSLSPLAVRINVALWAAVTLALAAAIPGMPWYFDGELSAAPLSAFILITALLVIALSKLRAQSAQSLFTLMLIISLFTFGSVFGLALPGLRSFWAGARLSELADRLASTTETMIITAGFSEPSFVFLTGTSVKLSDGTGAGALFNSSCPSLVLVSSREQETFLIAAPGAQPASQPERVFNYSKGKWLDIHPYLKEECS